MTRIILVLNLAGQGLYVIEDPRTPRELVMAINSGLWQVGDSTAHTRAGGKPTQWAMAHPGVATVTVLVQPPPVCLSFRQYQVLYSLADGLRSKEIAERLGITERTVNEYISELKEQLEASSRAAIIHKALELGLIEGAK